jgi:hypothetical protein
VASGLGGIQHSLDPSSNSTRSLGQPLPDRGQDCENVLDRDLVDRDVAQRCGVLLQSALPLSAVLLVAPATLH